MERKDMSNREFVGIAVALCVIFVSFAAVVLCVELARR